MNIKNEKKETISENSLGTNMNSEDIEYENNLENSELKKGKKKVTFEPKFVDIINIKSYKKYNGSNYYQKYYSSNKQIHCACFIF